MRLVAWLLLFALSGCAFFAQPDRFGARQASYEDLNGWGYDNQAEALAAFKQSCPLLTKNPRGASNGSGLRVPQSVWQSLCSDAMRVPPDALQARSFFERRFVPFTITNRDREQGLFTGYYEPLLYGSKRRHGDFLYPLYIAPPELKDSKPYYTHAEINAGVIEGRKLELLWVDDPVMRFFLQIQGSGIIHMSNGAKILVGYADQNGQKYESLGKIMGDEGLIPKDQINFFTLRQWLYQHPDRAFELMERNPSYVFFRKLETPGVVGAVGAVLTPRRSLAVDNNYIPYGLPLFLEVDLPAQPQQSPLPFHRLMVAQDTGGAIRGPVRGDIFFGPGDEAEYYAGYMKGRGRYSLLVPREVASQLQPK